MTENMALAIIPTNFFISDIGFVDPHPSVSYGFFDLEGPLLESISFPSGNASLYEWDPIWDASFNVEP